MSKSKFANWYADRQWRAKRAAHLAKHPLCVYCEQQGRVTVADVVDHIEPHKGDRHSFWNGAIQSLCHHHHSSTKQREERNGQALGSDADGWPRAHRMDRRRDPNGHWNK